MKKLLHISLNNVSNIGDQAITDCMAKILMASGAQYTHHNLNYGERPSSSPQQASHPTRNIRTNKIKSKARNFKAIRFTYQTLLPLIHAKYYISLTKKILAAERVIIGGGNILMDLDYIFPLHTWLIVKLAKILKKEVGFVCVGVGPVKTPWGKLLIRDSLASSDFIIVRDPLSKETAAQLVPHKKIETSIDPVFAIDSLYSLEKTITQDEEILVSVFPYGSSSVGYKDSAISQDRYIKLITQYIKNIKSKYPDMKISLLVTDSHRDMSTAENISSKSEGLRIKTPKTTQELVDTIRKSRYLLSTRMHPAIVAASVGTSFHIISWQDKIIGCMKSFGFEKSVIDIKDLFKSQDGPQSLVDATSNEIFLSKRPTKSNPPSPASELFSSLRELAK